MTIGSNFIPFLPKTFCNKSRIHCKFSQLPSLLEKEFPRCILDDYFIR